MAPGITPSTTVSEASLEARSPSAAARPTCFVLSELARARCRSARCSVGVSCLGLALGLGVRARARVRDTVRDRVRDTVRVRVRVGVSCLAKERSRPSRLEMACPSPSPALPSSSTRVGMLPPSCSDWYASKSLRVSAKPSVSASPSVPPMSRARCPSSSQSGGAVSITSAPPAAASAPPLAAASRTCSGVGSG